MIPDGPGELIEPPFLAERPVLPTKMPDKIVGQSSENIKTIPTNERPEKAEGISIPHHRVGWQALRLPGTGFLV